MVHCTWELVLLCYTWLLWFSIFSWITCPLLDATQLLLCHLFQAHSQLLLSCLQYPLISIHINSKCPEKLWCRIACHTNGSLDSMKDMCSLNVECSAVHWGRGPKELLLFPNILVWIRSSSIFQRKGKHPSRTYSCQWCLILTKTARGSMRRKHQSACPQH